MPFKARMTIDGGEEIRLLHCSYNLDRDTDFTGRPSSDVRGGTIRFEIESSTNNELYEWIIDAFKRCDGEIKFFKRNEDAVMRTLKFEEAYLVSFGESFDAVGEGAMTSSGTISAKKIDMEGGVHENDWPE
jgi:hypothetical protein